MEHVAEGMLASMVPATSMSASKILASSKIGHHRVGAIATWAVEVPTAPRIVERGLDIKTSNYCRSSNVGTFWEALSICVWDLRLGPPL